MHLVFYYRCSFMQCGMQMILVPVVLFGISVDGEMTYHHLVLIMDILLMVPSVGCL